MFHEILSLIKDSTTYFLFVVFHWMLHNMALNEEDTQHNSKSFNMTSTGFLDLPTELRLLVYSFIDEPIFHYRVWPFCCCHTLELCTTSAPELVKPYNPGVLAKMRRVCQKLYWEIVTEVLRDRHFKDWVYANLESICANATIFSKHHHAIYAFAHKRPDIAALIPKIHMTTRLEPYMGDIAAHYWRGIFAKVRQVDYITYPEDIPPVEWEVRWEIVLKEETHSGLLSRELR